MAMLSHEEFPLTMRYGGRRFLSATDVNNNVIWNIICKEDKRSLFLGLRTNM